LERDSYPNFFEWCCANYEEYEALGEAKEGRPESLARLILEIGELKTLDARKFVSDRLWGKPFSPSQRKVRQMSFELNVYNDFRELIQKGVKSKYEAYKILLERADQFCEDYPSRSLQTAEEDLPHLEFYYNKFNDYRLETLKTHIRNGKAIYDNIKNPTKSVGLSRRTGPRILP
jgi:hypothetical protein